MLNLSTLKTPGVYIDEVSLLPPSVAGVETGIPAFVGYTERNVTGTGKQLLNKPTRITSLLEYTELFGGAQPVAAANAVEVTIYDVLENILPEADKAKEKLISRDIAAKLAADLNATHGSDATALIADATLRCLSRQPTKKETETGQKFLQKQTSLTPNFQTAFADYCLALLNSNEFVYID